MYIDYVQQPTYARPLAVLHIAVGILLCIESYRIYRVGAFLTALFVIGDYVVAIITLADELFTTDAGQYYAAYFCAGLIVGVLALLHAKASSAIAGVCAGIVFIEVILGMAKYHGSLELYVVMLTLFGVVGAVATALTKKSGFIVATSLVGASVIITGVRYFAFATIYDLNNRSRALGEKLNSAWWSTCAVEIAIFVLAIPLQLLLTARGINHHGDRSNEVPLSPLQRQQPSQQQRHQSEQQEPAYSGVQYDHYQYSYNSVQTPQPDTKSSYVTGHPVSHV